MIRTVDTRINVIRDGAELTQLRPVSAPTIKMDQKGAIKSSCFGEFLENPLIDWLRDELQPVLIINGTAHPCGVYIPTTVTPTITGSTSSLQVEAYDRCWLLQNTRTENILHLAAGTNYITAIKQLLTGAGISLLLEKPTSSVLSNDREDWEVGTDYLSIINQLLDEINYSPIWFNAQGYAVLQPESPATAENITHSFDDRDVSSLLIAGLRRQQDLFSAPNVFICVCSNPDKSGPMKAVAENTNPQSALSIPRRGRRIAKQYRVNNIADQAALNAYAERLRNESMQIGETITITTGLRAGHGIGEAVGLHYGELNGICKEVAWQMSFEPGGTMTHTLERQVYNLDQ